MIKKIVLVIGITLSVCIIIGIVYFITIVDASISLHKDSFESKEEVVIAVKSNANDINGIINKIMDATKDNDFTIIENDNKKFKNSIVLKNNEIDNIFKELKLNDISIRKNDDVQINFNVRFNSYSNICGFYYSKNDNPMYDGKKRNIEFPYIQYNNWTLLLGRRYGWYTEKIIDNWYYYESYEGPRTVVKYIEDDLKKIDYYDRVIHEIEEYEQQRDRYRK